jgi:hypothetical protein
MQADSLSAISRSEKITHNESQMLFATIEQKRCEKTSNGN